MNSPMPITSRANRRRAPSLESTTTPLLASIPQRKSDRRVRDEAAQRTHRMYVVSTHQFWSIYTVLALLYLGVVGIVYLARRPNAFVPPLPDMAPGETAPAWEHLEAITTEPHPFNSRANTDVVKKYIINQFKTLQAEAIALGRRNVRYYDREDNTTWTELRKSSQQRRMEDLGEIEPNEGETLKPEVLSVVQGDNLIMWVGGVTESMEGDIPVKIEIDVDQESQAALMVSAHYDSVPSSYGATDDGGGIAVALAMIQYFIHHPVQHTLIFNLNNAEELGSYGAAAFMGAPKNSTTETGDGHPWKKYVRAFINLEGGGSGGPSLLFRATDHDIIRHYVDNAPFPHASVFINDVFQFELINSDTDYSTFIEHGIPGLDIAFYQRRSMYHTITDTLPIQSLFHMGSNAQATIAGLCNSDYLDSLAPSTELITEPVPVSPRSWFAGKSVFFDFLGKQMIYSDLWTTLLINALAIGLGLPVLASTVTYVGRAIRRRQHNRRSARLVDPNPTPSLRSVLHSSSTSMGNSEDGYGSVPTRSNNFRQHGRYTDSIDATHHSQPKKATIARATALVALIVMFDLGAVAGASRWQYYVNPMARYSHPWLILAGFAWLLLIVNTFVVYLATLIESSIYEPVPILSGATLWTFAVGVWWWLVALAVGTGVAGWFSVGAFYGTTALAAFAGVSALIQIILNFSNPTEGIDDSRLGWILVLGLGLIVPGVIVLDMAVTVVYVTSQSVIGGDAGMMYIIYGVLLIPVLLPTVPVISRGRNFKKALWWELIILALVAWWLSQVKPYTANEPATLYFYQLYNQTSRSSIVDLRTDATSGYLGRMIQDVPSLSALVSPSKCIPEPIEDGGAYTEACQFEPARQIFEDDGKDQPLHIEWIKVPESGPDGWREGRLQVLALESRACSIYLAETSPGRETQIWMESEGSIVDRWNHAKLQDNHRPKSLHAYVRDWNQPWSAVIRMREPDQSEKIGNGNKTSHQPVALKVVCAYNDWYSGPGYASMYNEIRAHIPSWTRLRMYKRDLFEVGVDMTF
ncbi:hypothetical protein BGX21_009141 [Mortierella sp. AD011]|nr:hypothetical protein BGX20_010243 [Mortierella sp. AD010]KAF9397187.1 hypothetical protein BGX21_009141 [Mortierella sp. AD011]